jgi:hypothetical protein
VPRARLSQGLSIVRKLQGGDFDAFASRPGPAPRPRSGLYSVDGNAQAEARLKHINLSVQPL